MTAASALCLSAHAQSTGEFWPEVLTQIQLPHNFRTQGYLGLQNSESSPYRQIFAGGNLAYNFHRIAKQHVESNNSDKEHTILLAVGYEYLHTLASGKLKDEERINFDGTLARRPLSALLFRDRNRIELRWVNGSYSTRYRNQLSLDYDIVFRNYHFTPYGAVEVYYDGGKGLWNEQQYTAGCEWPYRKLLILQTYYLRQHCTTCNPVNVNAAGLTLNFYFGNSR